MANIPIKYRTAKNFRHNQYDFSVTSSQGNLEVNFFICSAFYPSAPAFYPSVPAFYPSVPAFCPTAPASHHSVLEAKSIPF